MAREAVNDGGAEHAWRLHARLDQQWPGFVPWWADEAPSDTPDWTTWLLLGGRGAGKTRAGAEWIRFIIDRGGRQKRIALVAEAYADAREVMID